MKRVMAAEYSRELSTKVSRAQRQQARLAYKQGGPVAFGLRRQLVDDSGKRRRLLAPGERKALSSERVVFVAGPAAEIALIRRIFKMYFEEELPIGRICARLTRSETLRTSGRPWTYENIRHLLKNERYTKSDGA